MKILVNDGSRVIGSIQDGGDFDDVGNAKRGKAFLEGLQHFKSRGLICIFVLREGVRNDSVRDCIDDVKDAHKIGVSVVHEVGRGLVVLGLRVVDFGNALSLRKLKYTRWCDFWTIKDFSRIFSFFYIGFFELGSIPC